MMRIMQISMLFLSSMKTIGPRKLLTVNGTFYVVLGGYLATCLKKNGIHSFHLEEIHVTHTQ